MCGTTSSSQREEKVSGDEVGEHTQFVFCEQHEHENYPPSLGDDRPAASSFKRSPVLFPPSFLYHIPVAWPSEAVRGERIAHAKKQIRKN